MGASVADIAPYSDQSVFTHLATEAGQFNRCGFAEDFFNVVPPPRVLAADTD